MESTLLEQNTLFLDSLLDKVYQDGGYDFRDYKRGTVTRRLARRLQATGARTYLEYTEFLDDYPEEYQDLVDDLTIKVSSFFRSEYSFQQVAKLVLPELVSSKESKGDREIRFWSTACARGEEPYSLAILLSQFLGQKRCDFDVSIYATDISQRALSEAQAGVYSTKDMEGLSPGILQNHFVQHGQGYEVNADIRQMVNFSHFNLASVVHPPFVNLDAIYCCNVLIYFQKQLQERVLNMLYGALATPGYLILGEVETPTSNLYGKLECLDNKARIYKKVNIPKK
jgi:two-component system CheB/CheR fusion protein